MVKWIVAIGVVGAAAIGIAAAQQSARDIRREVTGTGSISGRVTAADSSHRPLPWAAVTLTSESFIAPRIVVTSDDGRFVADRLAAGQYALSVAKPAYVTMNYGATRPERQGTSIALADGQAVTGVDVQLPKGAAIAGTIVDSRGEPRSAYVSVLRWQFYDGERKYAGVKVAQSDARGQFRVFGLVPGDYVVAVDANNGELLDASYEFTSPSDADVDRALQRARQQPGLDASDAAARAPRTFGFAPVYFPGTSDIARATRITLAAGDERTGVDIRLDLAPMARLDGRVTSLDGTPLAGLRATLSALGPPVPNYRFSAFGGLSPKTLAADGTFSFTGVPPGEYSITVMSPPPGRGSAPPTAASVKFAYTTLTIAGNDQQVTLTLQSGMAVTGKFARDGTTTQDSFKGASVNLQDLHIDQTGIQRSRRADLAADGTFEIFGLWPGRFLFTISGPGADPPDTWALKSAVANGRDWLDGPFELKPGDHVTDLIVTLTDHPSELTGHLQTPANTPATDYFIIVFSANRAHWFPNSRRIVSARTNTKGDYRIRGLPAGDYLFAVVTDVELGAWFDPPFLESLAASARRLTIADGEHQVQDWTIRSGATDPRH